MKADDPRHGTYAGAKAHEYAGEKPCPACKRANAEYMAQWRKRTKINWRARRNARGRALDALARMYPDDFERLYVEERMNDHSTEGTRGAMS